MAKSPQEMAESMIANLPAKTGKSLEQWLKITGASGLEKHGQLVKMLKVDHGITHGFANLIAHKTLAAVAGPITDDGLVEAQYSAAKAGLRPIYEAVLAAIQPLGKDVEVAPKKSYVSLRRNKQFALIQPSTKTRVDLGLNLKGTPPGERLEASGSFNSMVTHRVRLTEASQVDQQVIAWLKAAYDGA